MSSPGAAAAAQRGRATRGWLLASALVLALGASSLGWRALRARGLGRPFKVFKITADPGPEHAASAPEAGDPALAARQSLAAVARIGAGVSAARPVRQIDGAAFIASAERSTRLSPAQRARLTSTFQLAAKLQATVDGTDGPGRRADLQRRLDDQVRTRLRLILPADALALVSQLDEAGGPVAFQFRQSP